MTRITNGEIIKIRQPKPRYPIIREIAERFSPRFFKDEPVKEADLKTMFEAARFAPSGHNHQPWYFYWTTKNTDSYKKLFTTLNDYNQAWAKTAPLLILTCYISYNEKGENPFALYDLGACVFSLVLQARALGYYSRQMALFDKQKVKKSFKLGKYHEPYTIITLGKIGDYINASKYIIDMELDPRPRKTDLACKL